DRRIAHRRHRAYQPRPRARIPDRRPVAMSDQASRDQADDAPRPRVVMMEGADTDARAGGPLAPQVITTGQTGRIVPRAPVAPPLAAGQARARRTSRAVKLGVTGLGTAFVGWLGIDAYLWIASAFEHGAAVGWAAAAAVAAGVGGAGLITARELRS